MIRNHWTNRDIPWDLRINNPMFRETHMSLLRKIQPNNQLNKLTQSGKLNPFFLSTNASNISKNIKKPPTRCPCPAPAVGKRLCRGRAGEPMAMVSSGKTSWHGILAPRWKFRDRLHKSMGTIHD